MLFGLLFSNSKRDKRKNIGELIVGFSLLFLGLSFMKNAVSDLRQTPEVLAFVSSWASHGFGSVLLFLGFGTVLTLILQSSSATMAITLIMLSMGWIPFDMACDMVLGENIGTTITANIAASVGNTQAKRAAMSHTIFNVFGVVWALIHYGPADKRREVHLPAHKVKSNGMLKISRKYMVGEVEIEGLFVEVMGNMPYGFLGSVNANVRSGAGCGRYLT